VVDLDPVDGSDDFIGRRIDDGDVIAGTIGLDDANGSGRQWQGKQECKEWLFRAATHSD
jgi:hypothetical protein